MFISPISFSLAPVKQQKTNKYNNFSYLNGLQADTVTFSGYTKSTHNAFRKVQRAAQKSDTTNSMEAAMQEAKNKAARAVTFTYDEMKKMLVDFVMYEPECKLVIGEPHTKQEADAMLKILGIRKNMLDYINLTSKGNSGLTEAERLERATEIQLYQDRHSKTFEYLTKLSDEADELGDSMLDQFYTRMELENINPKGNMTTDEIISYIKGCKYMLESDPLEMDAIQKGRPTISSVIESVRQPVKKVMQQVEAKTKPKEVKPEVVQPKKVKPPKTEKTAIDKPKKPKKSKTAPKSTIAPAKATKPISQMSKDEAAESYSRDFAKLLVNILNPYRKGENRSNQAINVYKLLTQKYLCCFDKFGGGYALESFHNGFNKAIMPLIDTRAKIYNRRIAAFDDFVATRLDEHVLAMDASMEDILANKKLIDQTTEKLNTKGVRGKTELKAKLTDYEARLDKAKTEWCSHLEQFTKGEAANREDAIERGLEDKYSYLVDNCNEITNYKRWEQVRQDNGGVIPEDTWAEISKFYGEYINSLYEKKESVVPVTKFAFNR